MSYLLGTILLLTGSWLKFQVIINLLVLVIAGYGLFLLAKRTGAEQTFALIAGILFMTSVSVTAWITKQHFTSVGLILIPYVLYYAIDFLEEDRPLRIWGLALSMALIVETHFLSALFAVVALVILFIIGLIIHKNKLAFFRQVAFAGTIALLLTLNVWGSLLDVYHGNHLLSTWPYQNLDAGAMKLSFAEETETQLGLTLSILLIIQLIYVATHLKQVSRNNLIFSFIGGFFLLLSSKLMLWNFLGAAFPSLTTLMQYPSRIRGIAVVFLFTAIALSCSENAVHYSKLRPILTGSLLLVATFAAFNTYMNMTQLAQTWHSDQPISATNAIVKRKHLTADQIRGAFRSANLSKGLKVVPKSTPDYLPTHTKVDPAHYLKMHPYALVSTNLIKNNGFDKFVLSDGTLKIKWYSKTTKQVTLPAVIYAHSNITLNKHNVKATKLTTTQIGNPIVQSKPGNNVATINYHTSKTVSTLIWISLILWPITLLVILVVKTIKVVQNRHHLSL